LLQFCKLTIYAAYVRTETCPIHNFVHDAIYNYIMQLHSLNYTEYCALV